MRNWTLTSKHQAENIVNCFILIPGDSYVYPYIKNLKVGYVLGEINKKIRIFN